MGCPPDKIAFAFALLLWVFVSSGYASHDKKSDPAAQQVSDYEDSGYDFSITLDHLAQKYGIPTGIDTEIPIENQPVSVHVHRGTVADVLNAIVAREPGYKWLSLNGVIDVMPKESANSILDIRIARFRVKKATFFDIHTAIASRPEVKKWLKQNHLTERTPMAIDILVGKNGAGLSHVSLDLRDVTVREILNKIAVSPGFRSWIVGRWGDKNQYLSIGVG